MSVYLSDTRVHSDKAKEPFYNTLIPWENLSCWFSENNGGFGENSLFRLKLWSIVIIPDFDNFPLIVTVKFYHTRYRTLGPELTPVYRQSAWRLLYIHSLPQFSPDLRSPSQPKNVTVLRPAPSYTAWWQRHIADNNLSNVATQVPLVRIKPTI